MAVGIARVFTSCWRHTGERPVRWTYQCRLGGGGEGSAGLALGQPWGTRRARAGTVCVQRPLDPPCGGLSARITLDRYQRAALTSPVLQVAQEGGDIIVPIFYIKK